MTLISSSFCAAVDQASRPPLREGDPVRLGAAASGDGSIIRGGAVLSGPVSVAGPGRLTRRGDMRPLGAHPAAREKESIPPSPHDPPSGEGPQDHSPYFSEARR